MARLAHVFFWGYALMLIGIGASGVLVARWELVNVFALPLASLDDTVQATLLNQYRFLKALELAFSIFCVSFRHDVFRSGVAHRVFLAGVSAGVAARLGALIADGAPRPLFLLFAALELVTGVLVWLTVWQLKRTTTDGGRVRGATR